MGNEEKEYKGYFHPWKGTHSEDGIIGTTILIIGVHPSKTVILHNVINFSKKQKS